MSKTIVSAKSSQEMKDEITHVELLITIKKQKKTHLLTFKSIRYVYSMI